MRVCVYFCLKCCGSFSGKIKWFCFVWNETMGSRAVDVFSLSKFVFLFVLFSVIKCLIMLSHSLRWYTLLYCYIQELKNSYQLPNPIFSPFRLYNIYMYIHTYSSFLVKLLDFVHKSLPNSSKWDRTFRTIFLAKWFSKCWDVLL